MCDRGTTSHWRSSPRPGSKMPTRNSRGRCSLRARRLAPGGGRDPKRGGGRGASRVGPLHLHDVAHACEQRAGRAREGSLSQGDQSLRGADARPSPSLQVPLWTRHGPEQPGPSRRREVGPVADSVRYQEQTRTELADLVRDSPDVTNLRQALADVDHQLARCYLVHLGQRDRGAAALRTPSKVSRVSGVKTLLSQRSYSTPYASRSPPRSRSRTGSTLTPMRTSAGPANCWSR